MLVIDWYYVDCHYNEISRQFVQLVWIIAMINSSSNELTSFSVYILVDSRILSQNEAKINLHTVWRLWWMVRTLTFR